MNYNPNIIDINTKVFLRADTNYNAAIEDVIPVEIPLDMIIVPGETPTWDVNTSNWIETLSAATLTTIIDNAFRRCIRLIDSNTATLISNGFEWPTSSGNKFSLSGNAQTSLLALHQSAQVGGILAYPYPVSQLNDTAPDVSILNDSEMINFTQTAFNVIAGVINAGKIQKGVIRVLLQNSDLSGLRAYTDPRVIV